MGYPPRANLQAVILPSQEILVINGGEYPEYKPVYNPVLMTPDQSAETGYKTTELNPAKFPRLYHNGAVLLPDARVLVVGGNANRAAWEKNGNVRVDVVGDQTTFFKLADLKDKSGKAVEFDADTFYNDPQHYFLGDDPEPFVPAEIWQAEIFSPPYLFKSGPRPEILMASDTLKYGQSSTMMVQDGTANPSVVLVKLGSVTHSLDDLKNIPETGIDPENPGIYRGLLEDLQGNILKGHGRDYSVHLFLQWKPEQIYQAKQWIKTFTETYVKSAKQQADEAFSYREQRISGGVFANFFLTRKGYEALGFEPFDTPKDVPFTMGMKNEQRALFTSA